MKQIVYKNNWFKIIRFKNWFYIEENYKNGAVILIQINNFFVFVKNFRVPINKYSIELPRGYNDNGENSVEAAIREAYEETGIVIEKQNLIKLGSIYPNNGILNSEIDIFYTKINQNITLKVLDNLEIKKVLKIRKDKIKYLIDKGIIKDSFTLSALYLYELKSF